SQKPALGPTHPFESYHTSELAREWPAGHQSKHSKLKSENPEPQTRKAKRSPQTPSQKKARSDSGLLSAGIRHP
ncbi:hypothetical protein, partial [Pseudomonas sp. efr-133-TYG-103a]|uniref:hypothetical protein n=1 Tax=Pseudomonas sp. efr-133-TYG-103a TaxID=3040308 RepID=UPI0025557E53